MSAPTKQAVRLYTTNVDKSVYFNGKEVKFEKMGTILGKDGNAFTLAKGTTHTLTMFYMERGMWESQHGGGLQLPGP